MDTATQVQRIKETTVLPVSNSFADLQDSQCCIRNSKTNNIYFHTATLTDSFLDFSASKGNNLRQIGLTAGCKWCLCANRWKEALEHAKTTKDDPATQSVVPKVHLHATHERALEVLSMQDLKAHASEGEVGNAR
jgi:uncharacterized protein (DUF2237 family)